MKIDTSKEEFEIVKFMLEKCEDNNYDYFDWDAVEGLEAKFKNYSE